MTKVGFRVLAVIDSRSPGLDEGEWLVDLACTGCGMVSRFQVEASDEDDAVDAAQQLWLIEGLCEC